MTTRQTLRRRAARGARELDERVPDWATCVDPARLKMESGDFDRESTGDCGCVMAQIDACGDGDGIGAYSRGIHSTFGREPEDMDDANLGFNLSEDDDPDEVTMYYFADMWDVLTSAWREQIAKRRG